MDMEDYDNSLVFANDSKLTETQNHGFIQVNEGIENEGIQNESTQVDPDNTTNRDDTTNTDNTNTDTNTDNATNGNSGNSANGTGKYQYEFTRPGPEGLGPAPVEPQALGETQVIYGETQVINRNGGTQNGATQADATRVDQTQRDETKGDETQRIQAETQRDTQWTGGGLASGTGRVSADTQVILDTTVEDQTQSSNNLGIHLTPSSPTQSSTNGASTGSGPGASETGTSQVLNGTSQSHGQSHGTSQSHLPGAIVSPFLQKSVVEIPGTVERITTQVPNTQERSIDYEIHEESEGSIHSDDEQFMYDDSVLNHKLKGRALDPESPIRSPREDMEVDTDTGFGTSDIGLGDDTGSGIVFPNKRQKRIVESFSTPKSSPKKTSTQKTQSQSSPTTVLTEGILREEPSLTLDESVIVSRTSVFANHKFRMYTGVVNNVGKDQLEILFEEGAYDIANKDLYPLDLRIGDVVKLKGSTVPYTVTGLSYETSQTGIRCIRGFNRVLLKKLRSRKVEEVEVNMSELYMELTDWYQHQQTYKVELEGFLDDTLTSIINDNIKTPTRNRHTQEVKLEHPSPRRKAEGILSDSLFCITSFNDATKNDLVKLIYAHGGSVIEDGFMELFSYRKSHRLQLCFKDKETGEYKFAALISNGISRSSKYLQTVALGWPILSEKFVYDVVENRVQFTDWPAYVLAAGVSSILNTTKSLDIFKFRAGFNLGHKLKSQINNNGHLLEGWTIVGLDNITDNKEIITCEFMFYVFGAKDFVLRSGMDELMEFVQRGRVLVYDNGRPGSAETLGSEFGDKVINWEWVVQCCISNYIWTSRASPKD